MLHRVDGVVERAVSLGGDAEHVLAPAARVEVLDEADHVLRARVGHFFGAPAVGVSGISHSLRRRSAESVDELGEARRAGTARPGSGAGRRLRGPGPGSRRSSTTRLATSTGSSRLTTPLRRPALRRRPDVEDRERAQARRPHGGGGRLSARALRRDEAAGRHRPGALPRAGAALHGRAVQPGRRAHGRGAARGGPRHLGGGEAQAERDCAREPRHPGGRLHGRLHRGARREPGPGPRRARRPAPAPARLPLAGPRPARRPAPRRHHRDGDAGRAGRGRPGGGPARRARGGRGRPRRVPRRARRARGRVPHRRRD